MSERMENLLQREAWARERSGPLYARLREHLEKAIRSGRLKAGDPLPSERDMARIAGVSRITVRKAVQALARDGLVIRKQGSGTSVAQHVERVQQSLSRLTSFTEDMALRGMQVRSVWLERGLFRPSPQEIMTLGLKANALVARISRLRLANDVPLAIERAVLSRVYLPDPKNVGASLYAHLARSGHRPSRAVQRLSARNLDRQDARLLEVAAGAASLNIERVSYLATGQVVEFTRSVYRGDAYDFVAELQIADNGS